MVTAEARKANFRSAMAYHAPSPTTGPEQDDRYLHRRNEEISHLAATGET